jgi:hypothetical protein
MATAVQTRNTNEVFNAISQPTPSLINQIQQSWQQIKDNNSDDDALRFEMLLVTLCSRVQAYSECVEHGLGGSNFGSGKSSS